MRTYTIPSDGSGNSVEITAGAGVPIGLLLILTYAIGSATVAGTPSDDR